MKKYKNLIAIFAFSVLLISLPVAASAQRRGNNGSNDDYYGGRNAVALSYAVKNLRNSSRRFEGILDRELDRSRYDGTDREDNLNRLAERFKDAAKDLDDEYDSRRGIRSSSDEARRVIDAGSQLDRALTRSRIGRKSTISNAWNGIEKDLNTIAQAYRLRYNGTYGRNGGYVDYGRNDDNGRYNRNLRATIVNIRNNARKFEKRVDREMNNSRDNRWGGGNRLQDLAGRFKDAAERLEDVYQNRNDNDRSSDEVRQVLNLGREIDRWMQQSRMSGSIHSDWNRIQPDLRILENAYDNSYSRSGRRGNFPF